MAEERAAVEELARRVRAGARQCRPRRRQSRVPAAPVFRRGRAGAPRGDPRRLHEDPRQLGDWEPRFDCLLQTEAKCPSSDPHFVTFAYVTRKRNIFSPPTPFGSVRVCAAAFAFSGNLQILSKTILHELSHRLDNTDDEKYCWPARYCEDLSTRDAIDNADSYARFAQEIFNISL
jgi:Lysine-specific metallo-endopeptidase